MVQIILAGTQCVQELADDQQRRIAGVVMDVLQAQLTDLAAAVFQQLAGVALPLHGGGQDAELHGGHIGDEDLMGLLHLRGKLGIIGKIHFHAVTPPFYLLPAHPGQRTGSAGGYARRPDW